MIVEFENSGHINSRRAPRSISWRVTGRKPDGTRIRENFKDKADARQRLADLELECEGKPDVRRSTKTLLSVEQLSDAEAALQQLDGASLSQVVAHYLNLRERAQNKGANLDQVLAFFESRYRPEIREITVLNARDEFLETRQGLSPETKTNYSIGLKLLLKQDPNRLLHSITVSDLESLLRPYTNIRSQRSFRVIFSVFFNWAVKRHYCPENPCERFDKLPKEMTQIAALSLGEVRRLLFAAANYQDGASAAAVAIGLFAGLRPSEIAALKPGDIGKSVIRVSGGKLRRKLKRSVPIPPTLAAWLAKYPFTGLPSGWDYKLKALKKATKAEKWVADVIRHTSISFQADRDKNEALTAYNCGTSIQMMNQHYRHTIDEEKTVAEFWKLSPEHFPETQPEVFFPAKRVISWPAKDDLRQLVWKQPLVHAAKELGVSDVALRKYCVKAGFKMPPQGYWTKARRRNQV